MYARIENNQVMEYPLVEGDLQKRFPDLKFPMDQHGTPIPDGYVRVIPVDVWPQWNFSCKHAEVFPVLRDGQWHQKINQVPYDQEEKDRLRDNFSAAIRIERNKLLDDCDFTQLRDVPEERAQLWSTYRQQLRDITNHPDFPFINVIWPTPPEVLMFTRRVF